MQNVTDTTLIASIDPKNTYASTEELVAQCKAAWSEVNDLSVSLNIEKIKNIVFCGMGASINGALVAKSLMGREFSYPSEIVTDYHIPAYSNEETLVVLTSYSGSTEEVLSCAEEAKAKNCQMLILTQGKQLAHFASINNVPAYIFTGLLNSSGVPRLGNGYTVLGLLGLLNKVGIITLEEKELSNALTRLEEKKEELRQKALIDFELFENKIPVVIASEHLSGNAQILRNQFNETSKTFSAFYLIPDLNHHLMEGLSFPTSNDLYFLTLNSPIYSPKNHKRTNLTQTVIEENKRNNLVFTASGQTVYDDFLEVLVYGSYLTLFLALRLDQDPSVNPWVDWFKKELTA